LGRPKESRYARQALDAAEEQRKIVARRLHDETIPALLTAAQELRDARAALPKGAPAARDAIERGAAFLDVGLNQLRQMASDLYPVAPIGLDLSDGVRLLAKQAAERGHFRCDVRVRPDAAGVDVPPALAIIRELLSNVAKHANARSASVEIVPIPGGLVRITVADDGIGVSHASMRRAAADGHIGLSLAAARAEELGGRFSIARNADGGTTVLVDLPALDR
jgi:two-component system NarL family sensor kinase